MNKKNNNSKNNFNHPEHLTYQNWNLPSPYGKKFYTCAILCAIFLVWSGRNVEVDKTAVSIKDAVSYALGFRDESQVAEGMITLLRAMLPPKISTETPVHRVSDFDPDNLPFLSRLEVRETFDVAIDYDTLEQSITTYSEEILVEPFGYLILVIRKMGETFEIGFWGTLVSVLLSIPLAYFSAKNYSPNKFVYFLARGLVSFFRTIPELIAALLLVLAFGFGPVAGILALGFHCTGFLGKFYAEDIENSDRGPQEACRSLGASKLRVLRIAVLPQVLPQYIAYTLYILDRNVRTAAVIGIVGAGGIGQELIGRYDMFQYSHVCTILLVLFVAVLLLDQIAAKIRAKIIR